MPSFNIQFIEDVEGWTRPASFRVVPETIGIKNIEDEQEVKRAVEERFPYIGMADVEKVTFSIPNPHDKERILWLGRGVVNDNKMKVQLISKQFD